MRKPYSHFTFGALALCLLSTGAMAQSRFGHVRTHDRSGMHPVQHPTAHTLRGAAPVNDECANAISLPVTPDCSLPYNGNNDNATQSEAGPSCDIETTVIYADVYFTFNSGTNNSVEITLTPSDPNNMDWVLVVSDGCGGNELLCSIQPQGAEVVSVAPNTDYIIRMYSNTEYGTTGDFTLCVAGGSPPPANDMCGSVTPQNLAVGSSLTFTGTTAGATIDGDFAQPDLNTSAAVWEAVTITDQCADLYVDYCGTNPAYSDGYGIIGSGCPLDSAAEVVITYAENFTCPDGNYTLYYHGVPAGTYYIPILSEAGVAYGPYTMNVTATACAVAPANDDCAGAIPLTPGVDCVTTQGTTLLATESMPADSCNGYLGTADDDVWYSFQATAADMSISVTGDVAFDAVVELLQGSCGSFTEIGCADATVNGETEVIEQSGLNVGETYYVRLFNYGEGISGPSTFDICVISSINIGVHEHGEAPIAWSVFPNPGNGELNIAYGDATGRCTVEVMDMSGRVVYAGAMELAAGQRTHLDMKGRLAQGTYTVRLTTPVGANTQRVVVK